MVAKGKGQVILNLEPEVDILRVNDNTLGEELRNCSEGLVALGFRPDISLSMI